MVVLLWSSGSSSYLFLMMGIVDSIGTDVKSAETSYLHDICIFGWYLHPPFTTEDAKLDGSLPFQDTIVLIQPDNSLLTSVYRKPTRTDLYLQWDSHHHLSAKYSVINTLRHRAKTVCSNHQLLKEEDHLNRALSNCRYLPWALNRARSCGYQNRWVPNPLIIMYACGSILHVHCLCQSHSYLIRSPPSMIM